MGQDQLLPQHKIAFVCLVILLATVAGAILGQDLNVPEWVPFAVLVLCIASFIGYGAAAACAERAARRAGWYGPPKHEGGAS